MKKKGRRKAPRPAIASGTIKTEVVKNEIENEEPAMKKPRQAAPIQGSSTTKATQFKTNGPCKVQNIRTWPYSFVCSG